jgi:nitroreductase
MELYNILLNRKSCRDFKPDSIEAGKINILQKAALLSPTGKRKNHWHFVFVSDKELLSKLAQCKPHGSKLIEKAPLAVIVVGDSELSDTWIEDCSIASIILQLQAEELGLGSCWVQLHKRFFNEKTTSGEYVGKLISLPENKEILSIIAIGYPKNKRPANDESSLLFDKIHSEQF